MKLETRNPKSEQRSYQGFPWRTPGSGSAPVLRRFRQDNAYPQRAGGQAQSKASRPLGSAIANPPPARLSPERRASILVGLLWCVALLSLVVIGMLHTSRIDLIVQKNYGDRIQAHYLAVAGIEKAKALLYRDARERSRNGKSHTGELFNAPETFRDAQLGRGRFQVFRTGREDEGGGTIYGVSDEEGRLNVNLASADALTKLEGLTPDIAAAIIDWRDQDNQVTPGGAEAEYYVSLQPPYLPRNGPIQTLRELLMVRGISRDLLLGRDGEQTATDGETEKGNSAGPPETGWARLLTVDSSVDNLTATGQEPVNLQTADERALTGVRGITPEIARAIVAYRGQNRFESVADLLDVTAVQNQNQPGAEASAQANQTDQNQPAQAAAPDNAGVPNPGAPRQTGPRVVSEDLLMDMADELTVQSDKEIPGAINVNTASLEVLICLPGISRQMAQAIISYRQSSGFLPNIAHLLKVPGLNRDIFKQVAPLISVRSETFRILSEGRVNSSRARQRIQEIVHVGLHSLTTVSYREDDL